MKSIIISTLYPPTDIYGAVDPNNLQLIVSGFTGTTYTLTGITDDTVYYTVRVKGRDCDPITKTFTFTITPTPTVTPSLTPTLTPSRPVYITWSPYDPYCEQEFACPATGMTLTTDNRVCIGVQYSGATAPLVVTYVNNRRHTSYSNLGAKLYEPNGYDEHGDVLSGYSTTNLTTNPLWHSGDNVNAGRLNTVGVWAITGSTCNTAYQAISNQWIGFTTYLTIPTSKQYYVGLAGDNLVRFKLNGQVIIEQQSAGDVYNFRYWHIYPVTLPAGVNIIEIEGNDDGSVSASFGGEVYDMTAAQLTGVTEASGLTLVFSTKDVFCQALQLGGTNGWSCPPGWSLDFTNPSNPRCVKRTEVSALSKNTGYKIYKYRRRLSNGIPDGYAEENLNGVGIGDYFPPVIDTISCPVGSIDPTHTPTPSPTITPTASPTVTPTLTPSATYIAAYNTCLIVADEATAQYSAGNLTSANTILDITINGMDGGYFGNGSIYRAFFISSSTCRPCTAYSDTAYFINDSTSAMTSMNVYITGSEIRFDGYLDPAYTWSTTISVPMGCTGGCMVKGTRITMADGTTKKIEELVIGDVLMSLNIEGLLPEEERTEEWIGDSFNGYPAVTTVKKIRALKAQQVYRINRVISSTGEHKHFVKREGKYLFVRAEHIVVGDQLFYEEGNFINVNLVESVTGFFDIYNIDVEDLDVYFVNGLLTHNKAF